jgi:hypothetical protein
VWCQYASRAVLVYVQGVHGLLSAVACVCLETAIMVASRRPEGSLGLWLDVVVMCCLQVLQAAHAVRTVHAQPRKRLRLHGCGSVCRLRWGWLLGCRL